MTATDRTNLRDKVRIAYSAAAEMPQEKHAFPVGRAFAESVGYTAESAGPICPQPLPTLLPESQMCPYLRRFHQVRRFLT